MPLFEIWASISGFGGMSMMDDGKIDGELNGKSSKMIFYFGLKNPSDMLYFRKAAISTCLLRQGWKR